MASKPAKRGLMASVLSRMSAGETLISDRHAESMLVGLLGEAEQVSDPTAAWDEVRGELCASWEIEDGPTESRKPFVYRDGVAVIPCHGILINRFNWCWGFVTGYDFIRKQKNLAMADPDVKLIVYDHDTPGGEAAGCDELAREIYADRDKKPSLCLVNTLSASGGYWLGAASNKIVCAPSGSVGSIGVYIQHMNIGKMLADYGIEVDFVKNGEFKTSGNQFEKMSDADRAYMQAMVDERAVEFHRAVAEFRGIEESVVKGTKARVMRPTEAIALGLIDAAESPSTAVATWIAEYGNDGPPVEDSEEEVMATEISAEDRAAINKAERERIKGITGHEQAKGREGLAAYLAHDTDSTVEAAAAILAASPKAEAPAEKEKEPEPEPEKEKEKEKEPEPKKDDDKKDEQSKSKSFFEQSMDNGQHPNVGPDGQGGDKSESQQKVAEILGAQAAMFGRTHKA